MGRLLVQWIILVGAVLLSSAICKALGLGFEATAENANDFVRLMIGTAILAFLNVTLGTVLRLLTLPLNCLTFGLFSLVVNAIVLIVAAWFEFGFKFTVEGFDRFLAALVASVIIAVVAGVLGGIVSPERKRDED